MTFHHQYVLILPSILRKFWLLWPNFYFRYQVPLYLWQIKPILTYLYGVSRYYFGDCSQDGQNTFNTLNPGGLGLKNAHKQIHPRSIQNIDLNPRFSVFSLNILTGSFLGSRYLFLMENLGQSFLLASKEACKTKSNT